MSSRKNFQLEGIFQRNVQHVAARYRTFLLSNFKDLHVACYSYSCRYISAEGLRTLAKQVDEKNAQLRSCKELVAESYKYFESLSDIATEISLATALVNMCQSLMKHSETYTQQYKSKHGKLYDCILRSSCK